MLKSYRSRKFTDPNVCILYSMYSLMFEIIWGLDTLENQSLLTDRIWSWYHKKWKILNCCFHGNAISKRFSQDEWLLMYDDYYSMWLGDCVNDTSHLMRQCFKWFAVCFRVTWPQMCVCPGHMTSDMCCCVPNDTLYTVYALCTQPCSVWTLHVPTFHTSFIQLNKCIIRVLEVHYSHCLYYKMT